MTLNRKIQKLELETAIIAAIITEKTVKYTELAERFGVSKWTVCDLAVRSGNRRKWGPGSAAFDRTCLTGKPKGKK